MLFTTFDYFLIRFGFSKLYLLYLDGVKLKEIQLSKFKDQNVVFITKTSIKFQLYMSHVPDYHKAVLTIWET